MTSTNICNIEPFRYQSTPQPIGDAGASSNQINETFLEDYLNRMRQAVCDDIQNIIDNCCNGGGGGGAETFLELNDTPATYNGQAGKAALVNIGETGLIFGTLSPGPDEDGLWLDMSTSEQSTNRTHTTGATIYQKTFLRPGNLPTGSTNIAHGITGLSRIIHSAGSVNRSNGQKIPINFPANPATFILGVLADATNVIIQVGTGWAGAGNVLSDPIITLFYTKS